MLLHFFISLLFSGFARTVPPVPQATGHIKITFINKVKEEKLRLNETAYSNPYGENYTIRKFKYYISNVSVQQESKSIREKNAYHLVDESKPASLSFSFPAQAGTYKALSFLLGVDSLRNVSGAQTGALDPLNDMFWTWNTGYVMAKLEASSPQSGIVNRKVEYHIGGFMGINNVLKTIQLDFTDQKILQVKPGKTSEIVIEADADKWWGPYPLRIKDNPSCTVTGELARQIAGNYARMFTLKNIINP